MSHLCDDSEPHVYGKVEDNIYGDVLPSKSPRPTLSRTEAEDLLLVEKEEGTFLVRNSASEPGNLTISVRCSGKYKKVGHFRICSKDGVFFLSGDNNKFETPDELVEFHQKNRTRLGYEKEVVVLKNECPAEAGESEHIYGELKQTTESWYYPNLDRARAEELLREEGGEGSFLVRPSEINQQNLTLSIRCSGGHRRVAHFQICREGGKFFLDKDNNKFPTLTALLDYLEKNEGMLDYNDETIVIKQGLYPLKDGQPRRQSEEDARRSKRVSCQEDAHKSPPLLPARGGSKRESAQTSHGNDQSKPFDVSLSEAGVTTVPLYQLYEAVKHVRDFRKQDVEEEIYYSEASSSNVPPAERSPKEGSMGQDDDNLPDNESCIAEYSRYMCTKFGKNPQTYSSMEAGQSLYAECRLLVDSVEQSKQLDSPWTTMTNTKNPKLLEELDERNIALQESLFEIVLAEKSYLKSIDLVTKHFMNDELRQILSEAEVDQLFSNIRDIRDNSKDLVAALDKNCQTGLIDVAKVCEVMIYHANIGSKTYMEYFGNHKCQLELLKQLKMHNTFATWVRQVEQGTACGNQDLRSFLVLPMHHIVRMPLLLEAVARVVRDSDPSREGNVKQCIGTWKGVIRECNKEVREQEGSRKHDELSGKISWEKHMSLGSYFEKMGELKDASKDAKPNVLTVIIFNEMLLITEGKTEQSGQSERVKYVVLNHISTSGIEVHCQDVTQTGKPTVILERGAYQDGKGRMLQGNEKEFKYMLSCVSELEQRRWFWALKKNAANMYDELTEVSGNEDHDQVILIQEYTGKEPDELSLLVGDIVMIEETRAEWIRGKRMRDGETGWFPCSDARQILNKQQRLENRDTAVYLEASQ